MSWKQVWRDDFDGPAGGPIDARWWTAEQGGHGWGNQERQFYTAESRNVSTDGQGHLAIAARPDAGKHACWYGPCRYTSARVTSRGKMTARSGKVEARIKAPDGQGVWPAFWMLGESLKTKGYPECGEIDIMELVGHEPDRIWSSVHGPGYVRAGLTAEFVLPSNRRFSEDFHTFAVQWSPEGLQFSVDGNIYHEVRRTAIEPRHRWVFDEPFHVLLNVAVGGAWPGEPSPGTSFPATMLIDYVALYRHPTPTDSDGPAA